MSHTPGPWTLNTDVRGALRYVSTPAHAICGVYVREKVTSKPTSADDWRSLPEGEANAHLIAAAPELLHAARLAAAILENGGVFPIHGETWKLLNAAIAKATGEGVPA